MHVLPELRRLEHKYQREMVIVGVHAGKFLAERQTGNIRQAALRLEVDHPVVNDRQFRTWRSYGVSAWPTLVLIDPDGNYVGSHAGEIRFESFDPAVGQTVTEFERMGRLNRLLLPVRLERDLEPAQPLAFPGKVLATTDGRLFIADTNHNRILILSLNGTDNQGAIHETIGSGQEGMADGAFPSATFNHPQGMSLVGDILYVADTGNHAIRALDLGKRTVITVAGTGEQANVIGIGNKMPLSSPWDLTYSQGMLYVAMAGRHQLWSMDLKTKNVGPFAGSGREDLVDSELGSAALAQPSGLSSDGQKLYFADTESSAIRWADMDRRGRVHTLVGTGLFDYGDKDEVGDKALLQHPEGLVWYDGKIYVADTYNNKIKVIDPQTRRSSTFLGTGEAGLKDGSKPLFDEPAGISAANGKLYVADTNNHAIRVADLATGEVSTLRLTYV